MKKTVSLILFMLLFILTTLPIHSRNRFFLQNRLGDLIKIDVGSAFVPKYPKIKGPRTDQIPLEIESADFDKMLGTISYDGESISLLKKYYKLDEKTGKYSLDPDAAARVKKLKRIYEIFTNNYIALSYEKQINADRFENFVLPKITDADDNSFIKSVYEEKDKMYYLSFDVTDLEKLRFIFMYLNRDNEKMTGLDQSGAPSPHNFPRVFEAKTKSNFDIQLAWGVKFTNIKNMDNVDIGYITLGFSLNLTNLVMPSLEIQLKYNFILYGYPVEPYAGAVLYGGFIDGFPIGLSAIGGADVFPLFYEKRKDNKNFYLTGEFRLGSVLYSKIYYDTGLNNEGIWKKLGILMEGGFYFGYGYIFDNYD